MDKFLKITDNGDALFEILMRVDPHDIFNCILVSKDCLSVITSPVFRSNYLNRWKNSNSSVVGLFRCELTTNKKYRYKVRNINFWNCNINRWPGGKFLATSNLGRNINARNLMGDDDFFVSKSPKGGLLLFGRIKPSQVLTFYVYKPMSGGEPFELPTGKPYSRDSYERRCIANIVTCVDDDTEYYVTTLGSGWRGDDRIVNVLRYCSWKGKWEEYWLPCSTSIKLYPSGIEGGAVAKGGDIYYWKAKKDELDCLAALDAPGCVRMIPEPPLKRDRKHGKKYQLSIRYGVSSPQGSLLAAVFSYPRAFNDWQSKWFAVEIWVLDDDIGGDKKDWSLLYNVRQGLIWTDNLPLLTSLFKARPARGGGFVFVSFVPGESDSILVALKERLFVYHFGSGKLECVEYLKYAGHPIETFDDGVTYHPLTMLDLGVWPSSPSSLQLSFCS